MEGFRLSNQDAVYFDEGARSVGAVVAGRRTYEVAGAWNGSFYMPVSFFVLTHNPPTRVPMGRTKFTFVVRGIEDAIIQAKAASGPKKVSLMGAKRETNQNGSGSP